MNPLFSGILVLASEAAGGEGVSLQGLLPKPVEFIPALISFAIVFFILAKYGWPAISDMLDKRAATIRESLEKAEEARIEAERLLEDYKVQLADARKEAAAVLSQAKQAAETTKAEITAKANAEAEEMISKARTAIEGEKKAAIAELQSSVAEISVAVAGKLIGSELSPEDHLKVIEKYVAEAGSLNAN